MGCGKLTTMDRERGTCCELPVKVDQTWAERRAAVLKAIADPTRLAMLAALRAAREPVCICDFTGAFDLTQPTISHHMAKLRAARLVDSEKRGIWTYYRLHPALPDIDLQLLDSVLAPA
jgi:ArsR family transcriptional regulator, arsenate/arsenite/antimonite-responsive transcriptional repressor